MLAAMYKLLRLNLPPLGTMVKQEQQKGHSKAGRIF
jgi:hypothetical protein